MWRCIYELAGMLGVNPDDFTLRELILMRDGKQSYDWQHTASVMAMIANTARDPKKRRKAFDWTDFYPLKTPKARVPQKERVGIDVLKVFLNQPRVPNVIRETN